MLVPVGKLALLGAIVHQHTNRTPLVVLPSPVPKTAGRTVPLDDLVVDQSLSE